MKILVEGATQLAIQWEAIPLIWTILLGKTCYAICKVAPGFKVPSGVKLTNFWGE